MTNVNVAASTRSVAAWSGTAQRRWENAVGRPGSGNRNLLLVGLCILLGIALVFAVHDWARVTTLAELRAQGNQRLRLYAATIRATVDRLSYLPTILAMDPEIRRMLVDPTPEAVLAANVRLEKTNAAARSANLYVMTPEGKTVAASNWNSPDSYVGNNYGFRPYFTDARRHGSGRFFCVGLTTRQPGYFVASAVRDADDRFLGATIAKIDLEDMQRDWAAAGEHVLVRDQNGVAILTSVPDWAYSIAPSFDEGIAMQLSLAQRYGDRGIRQLDIDELRVIDGETRVVSIAGRPFVEQRQPVPGEDWVIHYLTDWDAAQAPVRGTTAVAGSAWALLVLLLLYIRQRRVGIRAKAEAQVEVEETLRCARDQLERTVAQRTAALRAEVVERQKTERHLRDTQDELVHAGKMAALGQMSAAMAHEVNQPLTALRTLLSSTRIFVDRGDRELITTNFDMMNDLAERISKITRHLKIFARKSAVSLQPVNLPQSIERALLLLGGQLRLARVEVETDLAPAWVAGDPLRFEQVFVNVFRNAIDAMKDVEARGLSVALSIAEGTCSVRVVDSGPGIPPELLERLFEPFFTTKEVGEGLGLGLSLSYGIVRDAGGTIHAENAPPLGAAFVIRLPLCTLNNTESPR